MFPIVFLYFLPLQHRYLVLFILLSQHIVFAYVRQNECNGLEAQEEHCVVATATKKDKICSRSKSNNYTGLMYLNTFNLL